MLEGYTLKLLEERIGYHFQDISLLKQALTHSSFTNEQKINKAKRRTWGDLNPVIRKPENSKAYNRNRAQAWKKELPDLRSGILRCCSPSSK